MSVEAIGMTILGLGLPTAAAIIKFFPGRERREKDPTLDSSYLDRHYVRKDVFKATIDPLAEYMHVLGGKIDRLLEMHLGKS